MQEGEVHTWRFQRGYIEEETKSGKRNKKSRWGQTSPARWGPVVGHPANIIIAAFVFRIYLFPFLFSDLSAVTDSHRATQFVFWLMTWFSICRSYQFGCSRIPDNSPSFVLDWRLWRGIDNGTAVTLTFVFQPSSSQHRLHTGNKPALSMGLLIHDSSIMRGKWYNRGNPSYLLPCHVCQCSILVVLEL